LSWRRPSSPLGKAEERTALPDANPTAAARRGTVTLPLLPLPRAGFLKPEHAGRLAKRGRELLRAGEITHRELALLDCLLWSCRRPGQDLAVASYTALCKLAHMARRTMAAAIAKLEGLGLIARIERRARMSWHQGGQRSVQVTSCYRLQAPTPVPGSKAEWNHAGRGVAPHSEFSPCTVNRGMEISYQERTGGDPVEAAQKALAAVRERRQPFVNTLLLGRRPPER
jgi:hypothetical protein